MVRTPTDHWQGCPLDMGGGRYLRLMPIFDKNLTLCLSSLNVWDIEAKQENKVLRLST